MKVVITTNALSYPNRNQTATIEFADVKDVATGECHDFVSISNPTGQGTLYLDKNGLEELVSALTILKGKLV